MKLGLFLLGLLETSVTFAGPLALNPIAGLPAHVYINETLHMSYQLQNQDAIPVSYYFVNKDAPGATINSSSTCALNSSPSELSTLAAGQSCLINVDFSTGTIPQQYTKEIFEIDGWAALPLNYNFMIESDVTRTANLVAFGDSLTNQGQQSGTIYTNNDPVYGQNVWFADVVKGDSDVKNKPLLIGINLKGQNPNAFNDDYAWGGARTYSCPNCMAPGLDKQVGQYIQDLNTANASGANATVFIWIGANNFLFGVIGNPMQDINAAISNLEIKAGIKESNIYLLNLPDLGGTPMAAPNRTVFTSAAVGFNTLLLNKVLTAYPKVHLVKIFDDETNFLKNAAAYGFTNTTDSCSQQGQLPACKGYLYYDAVHPTAKAHNVIAGFVLQDMGK